MTYDINKLGPDALVHATNLLDMALSGQATVNANLSRLFLRAVKHDLEEHGETLEGSPSQIAEEGFKWLLTAFDASSFNKSLRPHLEKNRAAFIATFTSAAPHI